MHGEGIYGYGLWSLVAYNAFFFLFFILSFLAPMRRREWRSFGVTTAFIVALFTEMYGFPLTIYFLTAVLGSRYPALDPFSHASGHLWVTLLGGGGTMMTRIHLLSNSLMLAGLVIMGVGWVQIYRARGGLVMNGLYRWVRHPQYSGLFLITIGLLIQWPTIVTLLTFPVLITMYVRFARREENEMEAFFGGRYWLYRAFTPAFLPWPKARLSLPSRPDPLSSRTDYRSMIQVDLPSVNAGRPTISRIPAHQTVSRTIAGTNGNQDRKYEPGPKEESRASWERIIER